jgi:hypothetical protein
MTPPIVSCSSPNFTITSSTGCKGLCTKFTCAICLEYNHYTHHFLVLPHFWHTLVVVRQRFQQEPPPPPPPPYASSHTLFTNIHYVMTSVNEHMRCPCTLCESLDHFKYQCPTMMQEHLSQQASQRGMQVNSWTRPAQVLKLSRRYAPTLNVILRRGILLYYNQTLSAPLSSEVDRGIYVEMK